MEDWFYIILVVAYLLYEVFSRVFNWRPEVKEPTEEEESQKLDELFGEPEPPPGQPQEAPASPARSKSLDEELAEALGLPVERFQKKPPPAQPKKTAPPVRPTTSAPPPVPSGAATSSTPHPWEQQIARQKQELQRKQPSRREESLAERFESQQQKTSRRQPAGGATPRDGLESIPAMLRHPASARRAMVLREVLGTAPGLRPVDAARSDNSTAPQHF